MINEIRSNARAIQNMRVAVAPSQPSMHRTALAGALLGATWFGAAFPILVSALARAASPVDAAVYVVSGILFGAISGGSIGAVIGGRGR